MNNTYILYLQSQTLLNNYYYIKNIINLEKIKIKTLN